MITDDLVQFIRSGRASGMSEEELERLLITEGGWDRLDVDEARRKLVEPATPAPVVPTPEFAPEPVAPQEAPPAVLPIEELLSEATENKPIVDIPHDDFLKLFSKDDINKELTKSVFDTGPQQQLEDALNPTIEPVVPPTSEKKSSWSIGGILGSSTNAKKEGSQTTASTPPTSPIKFNLSALRASIASEKEERPAPVNNLGTESGGPVVATTPAPKQESPLGALLHGGGPKKTDVKAKRTMASDLLLHATQASPEVDMPPPVAPAPVLAVSPVKESAPAPDPFVVEIKTTQHTDEHHTVSDVHVPESSPFVDKASGNAKTKRLLLIVLGVVSLLLVIGGAAFTFMKFKSPNSSAVLDAALSQFFSAPSFTYATEMGADIQLTGVAGGVVQDGTIKFTLGGEGTLLSGVAGFADGTHKSKFSGGWQLGTSPFTTNTELEVRVIAGSLYVHALTLPAESTLDPELFSANWIKIEFDDIASALQLSGMVGAEEYGRLSGSSSETAFMTLLSKSMPITVSGSSVVETQNDVALVKTPIILNPDTMFVFAQALYKKNTGKELVLTEDEVVRLKGAFRKIEGFVWTDEKTGALVKLSLTANFDDDMVTVHAKGPVYVQLNFSKFGTPPTVETPAPSLTLPELKVYMEEGQKTKEKRARDQVQIDRTQILATALESYREVKGRYPKDLTDLYGSGMLATSTLDTPLLKDYAYRAYQKDAITKRVPCLTKGTVCGFYHLGVNLEDPTHPLLATDVDAVSAILGVDTAGCGGESGVACYDVAFPLPKVIPAPPTPLPAPQSATPSIDALTMERMKERDTKRISTLNDISVALALYFGLHSAFPETLSILVDEQLLPSPLPSDPLDATPYAYHAVKDGAGGTVNSFVLGASLEDATNPALTSTDDKDAKDSVVKTADGTGCGGQPGRYCYDL